MFSPAAHLGKVKIRFAKEADTYDEARNNRHTRVLYNIVLANLRNEAYKSVLDVGCGTGEVLRRIPLAGTTLAGVDLSRQMLAAARAKLGATVELREGEAACLPWEDDAFDAVICIDAFHYFPEPNKALREMHRVLRPGGRVIIAMPWLKKWQRRLVNYWLPLGKSGLIRFYDAEEMRKLLAEAGFVEIRWEMAGKKGFVNTARKILFPRF